MPTLNYLSDNDVQRLSRLLKAFESGRMDLPFLAREYEHADPPQETKLIQTTGTVTAATVTGGVLTPGSGPAHLISDATGSLTDTGVALTVYNLTESSIPSGVYCLSQREPVSGQDMILAGTQVVVNAFCSGGSLFVEYGFVGNLAGGTTGTLPLNSGGTGRDMSATGPGVVVQTTLGAIFSTIQGISGTY